MSLPALVTRTALVSLLTVAACGDPPALRFDARPLPVGYDAAEVLDVCLIDLHGDGRHEILVSTREALRVIEWRDGAAHDLSTGTGLDALAPGHTLHATPEGVLLEREGEAVLLQLSDIGTFSEVAAELPPGKPEVRLAASVDLDGDGDLDHARVEANALTLELTLADGSVIDVSRALGAAGLKLPGEARRLRAGDLDGDGDNDLLVVGGRLFALINNGGTLRLDAEQRRAAAQAAIRQHGSGDAPVATEERSSYAAPRPWFSDATAEAGLDFVHHEGDEQWDIRPTMGPGAAFADVNTDGAPDLFVVGGSEQTSALFVNDGAGRFANETEAWRLHTRRGAGMGAAFADIDNDGRPDLYVTYDGPNAMWHHEGEHYRNVSASSGTDDAGWGASAAFADIDADGDLDLYVTNYLLFDTALIPPESVRRSHRREDPIAMLPYVFPGQADRLYRNDGAGHFADITEESGVFAPDGKGLGALFVDIENDGRPDLYVANDTTPNTLWRNLGHGRFEEVSLNVGLDDPRGGMGLAGFDIDADGDEDMLLTNWQLEPNALYRNNHVHAPTERRFVPRFEDLAVQTGLAQMSVGYVGWGCLLDDLDNDGDADVYVANGYTSPDYETTMQCVGQRDQLFENLSGPGAFDTHRDMPEWRLVQGQRAGPVATLELASRSLVGADVDLDGDLDLLVTANNGPLVLLRNESGGRSLHLTLRAREGVGNLEAIGARVTLLLEDGSARSAWNRRGNGYLGHSEGGVRFGLGDATPSTLSVLWPDGTTSEHPALAAGRHTLTQPAR
ncbi:MAG: hypothetical protein DHS20C15_15420 [Planctomycetota bacterium]|nr:MAG: hypothetical protein DHS20C15_15420 [Planctomycetota bacterium]